VNEPCVNCGAPTTSSRRRLFCSTACSEVAAYVRKARRFLQQGRTQELIPFTERLSRDLELGPRLMHSASGAIMVIYPIPCELTDRIHATEPSRLCDDEVEWPRQWRSMREMCG
jgi:hypothetical protein